MKRTALRTSLFCLAPLLIVGAAAGIRPVSDPAPHDGAKAAGDPLRIEYLEIVTASVDQTCDALAKAHGAEFGEPIPELGNARTADLGDGGRIGVRAPMGPNETPVVRPYILVGDIDAAVKAAEAAGAQMAMLPTEIPGQGRFAIYLLGGIQHGLWER
jgi:predicted enzyme related to lactoylglutathione lyase